MRSVPDSCSEQESEVDSTRSNSHFFHPQRPEDSNYAIEKYGALEPSHLRVEGQEVVNTRRHVNDPNFGLDTELYDAELERIKTATKTEGIEPDYIDSEMMMRTLYESSFGIHNHYAGKQHPFALVAAHPKEDYAPYSSRYRDQVVFIEERVYEATGISMDAFFAKTRKEIESILAVVRQRNKKHSATAEEVAAAAARAAATKPTGK
jgi:hypothetical protein